MGKPSIGIKFPFEESEDGIFLKMNKTSSDQIKSDLIHLLLTKTGERLYNPLFGSDLLRFLFEPNDNDTYEDIKTNIQDSVSKFIPNITINDIIVKLDDVSDISDSSLDQTIFDKQGSLITKTEISGKLNQESGQKGHSINVKIDYNIKEGVFSQSDTIILRF